MEGMSALAELNVPRYAKLLAQALPTAIQSEEQFNRILGEMHRLQERSGRLTPEEDALFDLLAVLVEEYDERRYPLAEISPQKMLRGMLEMRGLQPRDLWGVLGSKAAVSLILNGHRGISKAQARELGQYFAVDYRLFL
jgi:HTH-type transcriptional regulator/antitoxin HigA